MNKLIIGIIAVIVIAGGVYFVMQGNATAPADTQNATTGQPADTSAQETAPSGSALDVSGSVSVSSAPMTATVNFNGDAFSPSTVTIAKGGTVTFISSGTQMWVASDPHPSHTGYSGTSRTQHCPDTAGVAFDQCAPGTSYSFKFQKTGSWGYHDHMNDNLGGTIVVK